MRTSLPLPDLRKVLRDDRKRREDRADHGTTLETPLFTEDVSTATLKPQASHNSHVKQTAWSMDWAPSEVVVADPTLLDGESGPERLVQKSAPGMTVIFKKNQGGRGGGG